MYRYFVSQSSEFPPHNLCIASERVFIAVSICFIIDSVRRLLDTPPILKILIISLGAAVPQSVQ
jgi:hypothetical protein